jgi:hypothetical protein
MAKKKYDVLSPDGFSIHFSNTYTSRKAAIAAATQWVEGYKRQGYYSSSRHGRIAIEDLLNYCKLIEV